MKPDIYLVVGVPGSGKSYVCEQLKHLFTYVHHDGYIYLKGPKGAYLKAIREAAKDSIRPLLIEAPFSVRETMEPLVEEGYNVIPLFIIEHPQTVADRYWKREKKTIPKGHLTRMETYRERALLWGAFSGTSDEVLAELRKKGEEYA